MIVKTGRELRDWLNTLPDNQLDGYLIADVAEDIEEGSLEVGVGNVDGHPCENIELVGNAYLVGRGEDGTQ